MQEPGKRFCCELILRWRIGAGGMSDEIHPAPEHATATQFLVQGALQQWLGRLIAVESVEVSQHEGTFSVTVAYVVLQTQERAVASFTRGQP